MMKSNENKKLEMSDNLRWKPADLVNSAQISITETRKISN